MEGRAVVDILGNRSMVILAINMVDRVYKEAMANRSITKAPRTSNPMAKVVLIRDQEAIQVKVDINSLGGDSVFVRFAA